MNLEMSKKFLIYEMDDNRLIADVLVMDESIWMTQKQMANLFDVGVPTISKHLSNIFDEGELDEKVVISKKEVNNQ
ncbi:MAG: hypothetical protein Q4Q17_04575 [Tissierellia bacterium]|nr:hypothetical protein [Tissierellia bacterium]